MVIMGFHRCSEQECPYFGQPSPDKGCACHRTDEQLLANTLRLLVTRIQLDIRTGRLEPGWGGAVFDAALEITKNLRAIPR